MKKFICIISPLIIGVITFIGINKFLNNEIENLLENKNLKSVAISYGDIYKDKGVVLNEYFSNDNSIIIQGSSELSSDVEQLPTRFFPVEDFKYNIVTNGRAYVQNLQHASILGSNYSDMSNIKLALVVSLQWFENGNGISDESFESTFSPVQFYRYLSNEKISKELKLRYATRISELLDNSSQFIPERIYANLYIAESITAKAMKVLLEPYYFIRENVVIAKDKGLLYKFLIKLPEKTTEDNVRKVDWEREYAKANEQGEKAVTGNDYYVNDEYFDTYLKDNIDKYKDTSSDIDLMISKEFEDYKLYLDTCEELGIKPYVIIMPTNGLWYDHKGMAKGKRDEFYNEVQRLAEEKSFDVLSLKEYEYTPYFMTDVMHLGWKGWLKIDEEIYNKFK